MKDVFLAIKDTPIPTILVVGGVLFILLSLVTSITGNIQVEPTQRRRSFITGIVITALGVLLYTWPPYPLFPRLTLDVDQDRPGEDYRFFDMATSNPIDCQRQCQSEHACEAYTYSPPNIHGPSARCFLKDGKPAAKVMSGLVSGVKVY